jgi:threonine dehydrogenase-like Zn-dependent dehydrogenase
MHAVTIPTLLGIMSGVTDNVPPIDMVLILWAGLAMLYAKAIIQKDMINIVLIGMGFIGQAILMALVFFK